MNPDIKLRRNLISENKYPGLSVLNFKFLFKKIEEAFRILDYPKLPSPYSIIPFISQAIGLDIPHIGSGGSPYSIISYYTKINKNIFLEKTKEFNYQQRRELIDELYDMLAPYILTDTENYIKLLVKTKYKDRFKNATSLESAEFKYVMLKKFDILHRFLKKMQFTGGHYAHLAHYGYLEDLLREQEFLKDFDIETRGIWSENAYPVVLEMQIDGFNVENKSICGWYILVPNYTEELLKNKKLRHEKLFQASKLAKKLGAKFAGMAGLVASFSKGGKTLAENMKDFGFTTGHSFTIANIYEIVKNISKELNLNLSESIVVVVGAAGSIGSGVAKLISENNIKEIVLIDMPNIVTSAKLERLKEYLNKLNPGNVVTVSKTLEDAKKGDLLVVATNATSSFLTSEYLKLGAVIIDDSFPKNVSRNVLKEREDIILLEGGVAQFSRKQSGYAARNIPDLLDLSVSKLISCKQAYGCLCETFILAANNHKGNYGLGDADPDLAKHIWQMGRQIGITNAVFQSYGFAVEEKRIENVKSIIRKRTR